MQAQTILRWVLRRRPRYFPCAGVTGSASARTPRARKRVASVPSPGTTPVNRPRLSGRERTEPQIGVRGRGHQSPVYADRRPAVASDQSSPPTSAVEALERLGSLSLRRVSMEDLLQTVADLTRTV